MTDFSAHISLLTDGEPHMNIIHAMTDLSEDDLTPGIRVSVIWGRD